MKHKTLAIFTSVVLLALGSSAITLIFGKVWIPLVLASVLLGIGVVYKSEKEGFVKSKEIRRSYEPPRHFNSAQTLTVVLLIMVQIGVCAYALLT